MTKAAPRQLTAQDWIDQGLRTLAKRGFTALKAEPLAKTLGVSRGSFYWHFADLGAYHAALLERWREVTAERIIADVEAAARREDPTTHLLHLVFGARPSLEIAVRSWATHDALARKAVQAIDRRRLDYVADLIAAQGLPAKTARDRAQILYWTYLGFALAETQLPPPRLAAIVDELIRIARAPP